MNFVAIIGIVDKYKEIDNKISEMKIKVEKPFYENDEDWYDIISVNMDNEKFAEQINSLSKGMIVGIKGRLNSFNSNSIIVCEKIQIF